jgi:hypothetical protein
MCTSGVGPAPDCRQGRMHLRPGRSKCACPFGPQSPAGSRRSPAQGPASMRRVAMPHARRRVDHKPTSTLEGCPVRFCHDPASLLPPPERASAPSSRRQEQPDRLDGCLRRVHGRHLQLRAARGRHRLLGPAAQDCRGPPSCEDMPPIEAAPDLEIYPGTGCQAARLPPPCMAVRRGPRQDICQEQPPVRVRLKRERQLGARASLQKCPTAM